MQKKNHCKIPTGLNGMKLSNLKIRAQKLPIFKQLLLLVFFFWWVFCFFCSPAQPHTGAKFNQTAHQVSVQVQVWNGELYAMSPVTDTGSLQVGGGYLEDGLVQNLEVSG